MEKYQRKKSYRKSFIVFHITHQSVAKIVYIPYLQNHTHKIFRFIFRKTKNLRYTPCFFFGRPTQSSEKQDLGNKFLCVQNLRKFLFFVILILGLAVIAQKKPFKLSMLFSLQFYGLIALCRMVMDVVVCMCVCLYKACYLHFKYARCWMVVWYFLGCMRLSWRLKKKGISQQLRCFEI